LSEDRRLMDARTQLAAARGSAHEHRIQAETGSVARAQRFYDSQMLDRLNARMREFVARQEMMFLSTADADGHCDSTFRAGPPGFVAVLSDHQLAWPEYRGNGVMASVSNISDNGHAGLLFLDFFRDIIGLHVNGRADLVEDADLRSLHPDLPRDEQPGRRPERWIVIDVEEAYVHCRKHIPQLAKRDRQRVWGTDDARSKGSDFFGVTAERARTAECAVTALSALTAERAVATERAVPAETVVAPVASAPRAGWRARLLPRTRR
jgi:predicted pyridoxine 5'-phosphate oxidase superfamily flavin-nucleotide-binding protein